MAAAYLHGVETIRIDGGSSPVYTVDGAITAIVGTGMSGPVNELTVCQTVKDFSQFGVLTGAGFTLPDAANIWTRYQSGVAYVVNVLDPDKHKTVVDSELLVIDGDTLTAKTAHPAVQAGYTVLAGNQTLSEGTDYALNNETGELTFVQMRSDVSISYTYLDPSKVTSKDIIGGYEAATGKRKGMELLTEGFTRLGADAKIIIVPQFDAEATVAAAMVTLADKLEAIAYIAAPKGTTLTQAVQGRGSLGSINFQTSSDRTQLFYPYVTGTSGELESLATHAAGLRMRTDVEQGYWFSISNRELSGVTGMEVSLTARIDDPQAETNRLNEKGITTVFNSYGTGFRLWGNRLACFPTVTHIKNFETAQRTGDLINESIRRAQLQYIDLPIDDALIDSLLGTVRTYLGTLKSIVGFSVSLDYDYDLADAFSKGQVPIKYDYTPKLPAERITNTSVMTRTYLANLISNQSAA